MIPVTLEVTLIEAAHLTDLVNQFAELLSESAADAAFADPAVARLVPDAYADDAEAASDFRRLTQDDLLDRRRDDAATVARTLLHDGAALRTDTLADEEAMRTMEVTLGRPEVDAWLRALTALRLVLAVRLGITDDADRLTHPRFRIYHWLGSRLEGLLEAIDN